MPKKSNIWFWLYMSIEKRIMILLFWKDLLQPQTPTLWNFAFIGVYRFIFQCRAARYTIRTNFIQNTCGGFLSSHICFKKEVDTKNLWTPKLRTQSWNDILIYIIVGFQRKDGSNDHAPNIATPRGHLFQVPKKSVKLKKFLMLV